MPQYLSQRSTKYALLCVPSLFSLALGAAWVLNIAPEAQEHTRAETQWRRDIQARKAREAFLQENRVETAYTTLIFEGLDVHNRAQVEERLKQWAVDPARKVYAYGQTLRLLDNQHECIGYFRAGDGAFLEADNPGLCALNGNDRIQENLDTAQSISI